MSGARIAVVHDWLDTWRGGENVLAEILALLPSADLFALVDFLKPEARARLGGRHARTSFLQRVPFSRTHFRKLLPLFPQAIESLDLRGYDVIVSVSHAVAKNVRVTAHQRHLCYCLTPMRYAWDLRAQYLRSVHAQSGLRRRLADAVLDPLQRWDRRKSEQVDRFLAISHYIADRIHRAYGRTADVVYPPVDVDYFTPGIATAARDYYLTASHWVAYKHIDAIVAAFRGLPSRRLIVAGTGPDAKRIRREAGDNVTFVGDVARATLRDLMRQARAFVFAAEEDFGIVPVEAQACGTPVVALGRGGAAEVVRVDATPTGVLFEAQDSAAIAAAIQRFEQLAHTIDHAACRENALRFSAARFRSEFATRLRETLGSACTGAQ